MNKAKEASKVDGKAFLREAFVAEQEVLRLKLALSNKSITHSGVMGEESRLRESEHGLKWNGCSDGRG